MSKCEFLNKQKTSYATTQFKYKFAVEHAKTNAPSNGYACCGERCISQLENCKYCDFIYSLHRTLALERDRDSQREKLT